MLHFFVTPFWIVCVHIFVSVFTFHQLFTDLFLLYDTFLCDSILDCLHVCIMYLFILTCVLYFFNFFLLP